MRRLNGDRGAMAILTALLVVILVGMAAFAVDMGSMQLQRRELQNSADAGALAIAQQCAGSGCPVDINGEARRYAVSNSTSGGGFFEQTSATAVLGTSSVTVTATGLNKPLFRRVLQQGDNLASRSATVSWGSPTGIVGALPLTISECEFRNLVPTPAALVSADALMAAKASGGSFPAGEVTFRFHEPTTNIAGCPNGPAGQDHPGGFGWLRPDASSCTTTSDVFGTFRTSTGASIPSACSKDDFQSLRGSIVSVPVYAKILDPTGSNARYEMAGYAAFFLSGWRFPSFTGNSYATGSPPCGAPNTCISGWFTSVTLDNATGVGSTPGGGGVNVIRFTD